MYRSLVFCVLFAVLSGCLFSSNDNNLVVDDFGTKQDAEQDTRVDVRSDAGSPDDVSNDGGPSDGGPVDVGAPDVNNDDIGADQSDDAGFDAADMPPVPELIVVNDDTDDDVCDDVRCTLRGAISLADVGFTSDAIKRTLTFDIQINTITPASSFFITSPIDILGPVVIQSNIAGPVFNVTGSDSILVGLELVGGADSGVGFNMIGDDNWVNGGDVSGFGFGLRIVGQRSKVVEVVVGDSSNPNGTGIFQAPEAAEFELTNSTVQNSISNGVVIAPSAATETTTVATISGCSFRSNLENGLLIGRRFVVVDDNEIGGNVEAGIAIDVELGVADIASPVVVTGNRIGVRVGVMGVETVVANAVGIKAAGNVFVQVGGAKTGTTCESPCNVISGNSDTGILRAQGDELAGLRIQGNHIGTSINGESAIPNTTNGILIDNSGTTNTVVEIGDVAALTVPVLCTGLCNLIGPVESTTLGMIRTVGSSAKIVGNFFGSNPDGTAYLRTPGHGVDLTTGGGIEFAYNYVASSSKNAVLIRGLAVDVSASNVIRGNRIGGTRLGTCDITDLGIATTAIGLSTIATINAGTWTIENNVVGCSLTGIFLQGLVESVTVSNNDVGGPLGFAAKGVVVRTRNTDVIGNYIASASSQNSWPLLQVFGEATIDVSDISLEQNILGRDRGGNNYGIGNHAISIVQGASDVRVIDNFVDHHTRGILANNLNTTFTHSGNTFGTGVIPVVLTGTTPLDLNDDDPGPNTGLNVPSGTFAVNQISGAVFPAGATVEVYGGTTNGIAPTSLTCTTSGKSYTCSGTAPLDPYVSATAQVHHIPFTTIHMGIFAITVGTRTISVSGAFANLGDAAKAIAVEATQQELLVNHDCEMNMTPCTLWVVSPVGSTVTTTSTISFGTIEDLGAATSEILPLAPAPI